MFYCEKQRIDCKYFNIYNQANLKQNFKNLNQLVY